MVVERRRGRFLETLVVWYGRRFGVVQLTDLGRVRIDGLRHPDVLALVRGCCEESAPWPLIDYLTESPPSEPARVFAAAGRALLADPCHEIRQGSTRVSAVKAPGRDAAARYAVNAA